jgi:hypothetical protein
MTKEMKNMLLIEQEEGSILVRPASEGSLPRRIKKDPDKIVFQESLNVNSSFSMTIILWQGGDQGD